MVRSVGGSSGYSYAASGASSGSDDCYDESERSPSTYFEYAASTLDNPSPTSQQHSLNGSKELDDLKDVVFPSPTSYSHKGTDDQHHQLEQKAHKPRPRYQEYYDVLELANNRLSMTSPTSSPNRFDRLDSGGAVLAADDSADEDEDYNQRKKSKKSKKKKKKEKKEKRKKNKQQQQQEEEDEEEEDVHVKRRSSVFKTAFQPSHFEAHSNRKRNSVSSEAEIRAAIEKSNRSGGYFDEENGIYPNDELPPPAAPGSWSPASLVNASRSKQSGGRTDQQGFYKQVQGSSPTKKSSGFGSIMYEKMQNLVTMQSLSRGGKELPKDYNLNNIGRSDSDSFNSPTSMSKSKKKKKSTYKKVARCDSIDWGDESALGAEYEDERSVASNKPLEYAGTTTSEIEMKVVDDCSYSDMNESNVNWNANISSVEKLVWYRDRRRLAISITVVVLFLAGCSALYFTGGYEKMKQPSEEQTFDSTIIPDSDHVKEDHPIYPLPIPPPIDQSVLQGGFDGNSLKPLSDADVKTIIEKITPNKPLLNDPDSAQAKAMMWALEDRLKYNVEVPVRVGVRYALATLYYATNGARWVNNTNWLNGHECLWTGVYCELGSNNIVSVTYLNLVTNGLDGSIPSEIGYIESLQRIELGSNQLVGSIPMSFSSLTELRTLSVSDNQLSGTIGDNLEGMKRLTNLDLANNRFRGHVPHGLGGIPTLSYVRLSNNKFTGAFPTSFISLNNLQTLLIDNNAIGGTLPALIGMMKTLVNLRLHKNDFYGDLPNFSDAVLLETAHFDDNFFTGPLPQFGSQRLRQLYLDKNQITGPIPVSYGSHPKLQVLSVRNNDLSSSIPASLASATSLGVLDLSYNKLTGELSQNLSQLTLMKKLYLNNNRFQGPFPSWLGSMKNLAIGHFNNNLFSGSLNLGYEFGNLDYLSEFTIENNQLVGMVPEDVCDLLLDVLTADCWGNPAAVDCPCCTKCYGART